MNGHNQTFERLHLIASWILLCSSCVGDATILERIMAFTILEKYGFIVLLLIVFEGSSRDARSFWALIRSLRSQF